MGNSRLHAERTNEVWKVEIINVRKRRKSKMAIGMDVGTYNLVCCKRDEKKEFVYKREVNSFIEVPIQSRFVFNMMKNAGVPLIERPEAGIAYACGTAAVDMAYTMNQIELKRPMKDGCLNPKEKHAQQIMNIMVHSLIGNISADKEPLYYCIPANAVNAETDKDYHSLVLKAMFNAFEDEKGRKVDAHPINEALALIYAELKEKAWTGLGISFGAGMVNLCFAIFGNPVFEFSIVNSGDWIDKQAAKATGETPTFINKEKNKLDLTVESDSLVQRALRAQYEIMAQRTVAEIKKWLEKAGSAARNPNGATDIVIAGGTASPKGFAELFETTFRAANMPIEIGKVIRPDDPLFSVARGCLLAAEAAGQ
jgi:actin-like ATPase involved in cell morphogenesis